MPLIDGRIGPSEHREDVYSEFYNAGGPHRGRRTYATMIRSADRKIVAYHGGDGDVGGELYCLDEDPGEHVNRWNDPAYVAVKAEMLGRMVDRMALTVDPLPVRDDGW